MMQITNTWEETETHKTVYVQVLDDDLQVVRTTWCTYNIELLTAAEEREDDEES
jgi:hypothetical protein